MPEEGVRTLKNQRRGPSPGRLKITDEKPAVGAHADPRPRGGVGLRSGGFGVVSLGVGSPRRWVGGEDLEILSFAGSNPFARLGSVEGVIQSKASETARGN
jgi:hypothetical protein